MSNGKTTKKPPRGQLLIGAGTVAGALVGIKISASEGKAWFDVLVSVVTHPASTILLIILLAALMAWLLVRSSQREASCASRVADVERLAAQLRNQLDAVHTLLSLDRRYSARLPSLEDWRAGHFDLAAIASVGHETEPHPGFRARRPPT